MGHKDLQAFFHPAGVAVVGASESAGKLGHEIFKNLLEGGFPGAVYPVNPRCTHILGRACHKNVEDIPGGVDLAVLVIPARFVPQAIHECGGKGVKGVIIVSGGFSEAGKEGEELQKKTAAVARECGVRLLGPNCQGVNNPYHPMCASWPLLTRKGRVAVISQSGTIGAAMLDWFSEEGLGVSGFVGLGNRADLDEVDLIRYFEEDPNTDVIAAYLEGVKDATRFREVLASLSKPFVVLKSGRTPRGRIAAESHTRSLAGVDAVYTSLFHRYGVCRADTVEEFCDFAKGFAYLKPPEGNRILFITTSGGAAILATDAAEQEGLEVSPLPRELAEKLEGIVPPHAIRANPLDLTGDANARMFQEAIERARPYYDILGVIFGDPIVDAARVTTPKSNELIICLGGGDVEREEKQKMHLKGVPVFPTPERAIRTIARLMPPEKKTRRARRTMPAAEGKSQLSLFECLEFVKEKGFDCIVSRLADSPGKAVHLAHLMGFPVAIKIDSPSILHKSDCGGVRLNLQTAQGVRNAYQQMMEQVKNARPDARINGVVVSAMALAGIELILGMNRDPQFGPVIIFGLGGLTVDIFRDVSMRLLPIDREEALKMVGEIKSAALLKGYRGQQPIDENALADGLFKLAEIAMEHEDIVEIDLNPVIAYPEGIVVVDARIIKA